MRVQDVMTGGVQTVTPGTAAERAWTMMRAKGIHHLVVTRGNQVTGVLSDRDMGGPKGVTLRKNSTVADLMTPAVVTVGPDTTVRRAANVMRGRSIGCLVVTKGERPVGIVTVSDLLEIVGRGIDRGAAKATRPVLRHRAPHRKRNASTGPW
jgi:CBS domain-containing protein